MTIGQTMNYLNNKYQIQENLKSGNLTPQQVFEMLSKACEYEVGKGISEAAYKRTFEDANSRYRKLGQKGWISKFERAKEGSGEFSPYVMRMRKKIIEDED